MKKIVSGPINLSVSVLIAQFSNVVSDDQGASRVQVDMGSVKQSVGQRLHQMKKQEAFFGHIARVSELRQHFTPGVCLRLTKTSPTLLSFSLKSVMRHLDDVEPVSLQFIHGIIFEVFSRT
ncbi:MAG: hypothetical protein ACI9BD_000702 [Candidatus Marinamargulisbacteria bacterium]|jgi:hypothetical protein